MAAPAFGLAAIRWDLAQNGSDLRSGTTGRDALTLSSHLACTDMPQALQVLPCLLSPQIDV